MTTLLLLLALPALAAVPPTGLVWVPQSVRFPVAEADVLPSPPFVPAVAPEIHGAIDVGPDRGAAFYLDGLELARVRVLGEGTPRFRRVVGGSRSAPYTGLRAPIEVAGVPDPEGGWILPEPPGDGDVWYVDAATPMRVVIDRPELLDGRMAWEEARSRLLAAISGSGTPPELPRVAGSAEAEAEFAADAAIAAEILAAGGPDLAPAVKAWRAAAGLRAIEAVCPLSDPAWRIVDGTAEVPGEPVLLAREDDAVVSTVRWHRLPTATSAWSQSFTGGGLLRVQVRPVLPAGQLVAETPTTITISRGGEILAVQAIRGRPAKVATKEDLAFPDRAVLLTPNGAWAGRSTEIRLPLGTEPGTVTISITGEALVRTTQATRRPWLADAFGGAVGPRDWADRGIAALGDSRGDAAGILRVLLDDAAGRSTEDMAIPAGLPPALHLLGEVVSWRPVASESASRAESWRAALAPLAESEWTWWLRVRMADALGNPDAARAIFGTASALPPDRLLAAVARQVGDPPLSQDKPDRALGVLELAWRHFPVEGGIRSDYQRRWLDGSTWSRLSPVVLIAGDAVSPPPLTWLDSGVGTGGPISTAARIYYRLPPGTTRRVTAAPSPFDPTAPALLSVFLRTNADAGMVGISVDDRSFRLLPLEDIERQDLVVPPGSHTVTINAPAGSDAWVSLPSADPGSVAPQNLASLRSYWPVSVGGTPLRFEIPAPQVPVPVRLEVRVLNPQSVTGTVAGTLRTDTGASFPFQVTPGTADPTLLPVGNAGSLSAVASATLLLPAGTQQAWIEAPTGSPLVASISVRRTDDPASAAPPTGAAGVASLEDLATLGRALLANPDDTRSRLRRVDVLTRLGDLEMARQDLRRLVRMGSAVESTLGARALEDAAARIDAAADPDYLPAFGALAGLTGPMALSGDLVVNDGSAPPDSILALVRVDRTSGPEAGLAQAQAMDQRAPGVQWLVGRLLADTGHEPEGARALVEAWRRTGQWQLGLEAATWLSAASSRGEAAGDGEAAPLAYGIAVELRDIVDHPVLGRLALLAGRSSRWEAVRGVQSMAGRARVASSESAAPPLAQATIRRALVVPPWPVGDAQLATAKEPALVTVAHTGAITADLFCQALRVGESGAEPACAAELLVDGVAAGRAAIPSLSSRTLSTGHLGAGRHDIQVNLDDPGRTGALSVRFRADATVAGARRLPDGSGWLVDGRRDSAGFFASAAQPVEIAILGPGTLFAEVRMSGSEGGTVDVIAEGPRGALPPHAMRVSAGRDVDLEVDGGGSSSATNAASAFVLLPETGPWRVRFVPRGGTALVRASLRVEAPSPSIERPGPLWRDVPADAEPIDWALAPVSTVRIEAGEHAPRRWGAGTFSLGTVFGRQDLDQQGGDVVSRVDQLETRVEWRDQVVPRWLWLYVGPAIRVAANTPTVLGGQADAFVRVDPAHLRFHAAGEYFQQDLDGVTASGSTLSLRVFRPISIGGRLSLIPSLEARERILSLKVAPVTTTFIDADVWNTYAAAHPFALSPSLMLWSMPFQDEVALASLNATTNANVGSLDQIGLTLVSRTAIHPGGIPPVQVELKYRPSFRFADADRPTSYLRHSLGGSIGSWIRLGNPMLLWIGAGDIVYVSSGAKVENIFRVGLRFDLNGGRGLDDMLPVDQDFGDLLAGQDWGAWTGGGP